MVHGNSVHAVRPNRVLGSVALQPKTVFFSTRVPSHGLSMECLSQNEIGHRRDDRETDQRPDEDSHRFYPTEPGSHGRPRNLRPPRMSLSWSWPTIAFWREDMVG